MPWKQVMNSNEQWTTCSSFWSFPWTVFFTALSVEFIGVTTALFVPLPAAEQVSLPCSSPSSTITSDWTSLLSFYTKYAYIVRYFSCGSGHHKLSYSGLINLKGYVNIIKIPIIKKGCGWVSRGVTWTNKKIWTIYFLVFPQLKFGNN